MKPKAITEAQRRRFDIIKLEVGCIPCRMLFCRYVPADANHLLNGYRIGHDATVPECLWHHRGECFIGTDAKAMKQTFGPSRKLHKKQFRKIFGSDEELLAMANSYVQAFESLIIGGRKNENSAH